MELAGSKEGSDLNASHSPPRRRRSTFFERRSSLVPTQQPEDSNVQQIEGDTDAHRKRQYLEHISNYNTKLYQEKETWKQEARERRHQYRDIKDQLKISSSGSVDTPIDYSVLTKEDVDFLKGKPNTLKIAESSLELKKQVTQTMYFMKRLKELNEQVLSHCEERFNSVQKYILDNSTIEPLEETLIEKFG